MLVNNAGINIPKPAIEITEQDWDAVVDTNLKGSFFLSQESHSMDRTPTPGVVVNIASQAGIVGIEERAAYGTSKAGLIQVTKVLALEWATSGIRVNAVAPTFVRTELTETTLNRPEWAAELLSRIPMALRGTRRHRRCGHLPSQRGRHTGHRPHHGDRRRLHIR